MPDPARALLDRIIKARQLLLQAGAPVDGLSIRLHPADYMTLGMSCTGAPSLLRMPFVQDIDVPIGAPIVERTNKATGRSRPTDDVRVRHTVVPDDGSDGVFWRAGERWLRDKGKEYRLLDLAPHLEQQAVMDRLIGENADAACQRSKETKG
jgi:hypothetical protein